jgi:hypothetical protein
MTVRLLGSIAVVLLAALVAAPSAFAQGCAMCGSSFAPNDPTTKAFNTSVLFLMIAPYTIFFTAAGCIAFLYRRGMLGRRATVVPFIRKHVPAPDPGPEEVTP